MSYFIVVDHQTTILDSNGALVVKYVYDAWGYNKVLDVNDNEITSRSHVGNLNPFRYRSYFYDVETYLYYLKTRYYDPSVGRFLNMDSVQYANPEATDGLNLYVYCANNPVKYVDPTGQFPFLALILGITALVGMGLTVGGAASGNNILTSVGLTMVALSALISGGMAVAAGIGGATYLGAIGGGTVIAGLGTGLFASAEYQEAFTGNNWILNAGMSEDLYNGLMITTASLATIGTISCGVLSSVGTMSSQNSMMNSLSNHPSRWKIVSQEVSNATGRKYRGGVSKYINYMNRWTGSRLGIHEIIRNGIFLHGPHIHPWI